MKRVHDIPHVGSACLAQQRAKTQLPRHTCNSSNSSLTIYVHVCMYTELAIAVLHLTKLSNVRIKCPIPDKF